MRVLTGVKMEVKDKAVRPKQSQAFPVGLSGKGVREDFSTATPISLYGATKLASETIALEYGQAFGFPVWIDRCGVLAGAGQFARPDQGIFSYWIHSCCHKKPLKYIGFGGKGYQVRDCLHPKDLVPLILKQMRAGGKAADRLFNVSGGVNQSMSLAQLTAWSGQRFGPHKVASERTNRQYDVPWLVLDSTKVKREFGWQPQTNLEAILSEIAGFAVRNPGWLELSAG